MSITYGPWKNDKSCRSLRHHSDNGNTVIGIEADTFAYRRFESSALAGVEYRFTNLKILAMSYIESFQIYARLGMNSFFAYTDKLLTIPKADDLVQLESYTEFTIHVPFLKSSYERSDYVYWKLDFDYTRADSNILYLNALVISWESTPFTIPALPSSSPNIFVNPSIKLVNSSTHEEDPYGKALELNFPLGQALIDDISSGFINAESSYLAIKYKPLEGNAYKKIPGVTLDKLIAGPYYSGEASPYRDYMVYGITLTLPDAEQIGYHSLDENYELNVNEDAISSFSASGYFVRGAIDENGEFYDDAVGNRLRFCSEYDLSITGEGREPITYNIELPPDIFPEGADPLTFTLQAENFSGEFKWLVPYELIPSIAPDTPITNMARTLLSDGYAEDATWKLNAEVDPKPRYKAPELYNLGFTRGDYEPNSGAGFVETPYGRGGRVSFYLKFHISRLNLQELKTYYTLTDAESGAVVRETSAESGFTAWGDIISNKPNNRYITKALALNLHSSDWNLDPNKGYNLTLYAIDATGERLKSVGTVRIQSPMSLINLRQGGKGISFGAPALTDGFNVSMRELFYQNPDLPTLTFANGTLADQAMADNPSLMPCVVLCTDDASLWYYYE